MKPRMRPPPLQRVLFIARTLLPLLLAVLPNISVRSIRLQHSGGARMCQPLCFLVLPTPAARSSWTSSAARRICCGHQVLLDSSYYGRRYKGQHAMKKKALMLWASGRRGPPRRAAAGSEGHTKPPEEDPTLSAASEGPKTSRRWELHRSRRITSAVAPHAPGQVVSGGPRKGPLSVSSGKHLASPPLQLTKSKEQNVR